MAQYPGGLAPTRSEIRHAILAGKSHAPRGDVPIPGAWIDMAVHPELVFQRLQHRYLQGQLPTEVATVEFPKTKGTRTMSWLHPFDDVTLRALVGRASGAIEAARDKTSVFNNQVAKWGPGWFTKPYGAANQERKAAGLQRLDADHVAGLGIFDVASYYPSITADTLRSVLVKTGAPVGAVYVVSRILDRLPHVGGTSGLPIGPEFSGLLGNVVLTPLDKVMQTYGPYVRWTDDLWVFPLDEQDFVNRGKVTEETLKSLGFRLNYDKAEFLSKDSDNPWDRIEHAGIEYSKGENGKTTGATSFEMLVHATSGESDERMLSYALGGLTNALNKRGEFDLGAPVEYLYSRPDLFVEHPSHIGKFFAALSSNGKLRDEFVDPDWFANLAIDRSVDPRADASRLQACRVLATFRGSKRHCERLSSLAMDGGEAMPLRSWAGHAWAAGKDTKPKHVIDAAEATDSYFLRRSMLMGVAPGQSANRKFRAGCQKLLRLDPDLAPTTAFVLSSN